MLKYIILGIVQGMTEFLPVSSSGHLVIMQKVLEIQGQDLVVFVMLHLATALALIIFFFKDILKVVYNLKALSFIIIATIITGVIYKLGKNFFESLFGSPKLVAIALIFTGITLIFTKRFINTNRKNLYVRDAVIFGLVQGIAIIPGISRSGITISTLLFRKIDKETCFNFSFLAFIPVIFGATLLKIKNIGPFLEADFINLILGFISSLLTAILSLWVLKRILIKTKLYYFGYYCISIAIVTLLFFH